MLDETEALKERIRQLEERVNSLQNEVSNKINSEKNFPTKEDNLSTLKRRNIDPEVIRAFLSLFNISPCDLWHGDWECNANCILRILRGSLSLSEDYESVILNTFNNLVNEVSKTENLKSNTFKNIDGNRITADIKSAQKTINLFLKSQMKNVTDPEVRIAIGTYLSYIDNTLNN
ncbi:MAG: hypothetical protein SPL03_11585 [Succinivibrio dextrinosolvens]|nr:hypothetical protein [Succinivibrio dextrinosolvens]